MSDEAHPRVNISQIGGVEVVPGADGVPAVSGPAEHGAAPVGGPVLGGAVATAAAPAAVSEGRLVRLSATLTSWLRTLADLAYIGGTAILTGGVNGSQGVGGLAAQGANMAGNPVPAGGQYRSDPTALALDNTDVAAPAVDLQGHLVPRSDWRPIDGGGQRVNIGTAAYSAALTVGAEYIITAKADCWIASVANNSTPAVVGEDFFLQSYTPFHHVVRTGLTYIAVITDASTLANGLSICRVR